MIRSLVDIDGRGALWEEMQQGGDATLTSRYEFVRIDLLDPPLRRDDNPGVGETYVYFSVNITPLQEIDYERKVSQCDLERQPRLSLLSLFEPPSLSLFVYYLTFVFPTAAGSCASVEESPIRRSGSGALL